MKELSKDQQIKNCLLALANWQAVRPATVNLKRWKCGTHACFGGHLTTWPEFRAMGVEMTGPSSFVPAMKNVGSGADVAYHLFGDATLFLRRGGWEGWTRSNATDHEVIVHRLEEQIARLSS